MTAAGPLWEVLQGEALAFMGEMGDATVDAVVTDPPYSSGGFTRGDRMQDPRTKYVQTQTKRDLPQFGGDNRDQRGFLTWCNLWMGECLRITRPGGSLVAFTDWRQLPTLTDAVQVAGWVWQGIVVWHKPGARPRPGGFSSAAEYAVWASHGAPTQRQEYLPGVITCSPPRDREHLTQKPVDVMRELVKVAPEGGLVFDPFAGSGTTGVAAIDEGRRVLLIERDPHFAQVCRDRLARFADGVARDNPSQGVLL